MNTCELQWQVETACRHLLSEQNRDPYTPTYGCFDRRYWGWKLVDYPEATFQRNVYPLAWLLQRTQNEENGRAGEILTEAVKAGLKFAAQIQHRDGSFDQTFPNEHSFGATAFLLHPLLMAYQAIQNNCPSSFRESIENSLRQAADFLYRYDETHSHIANHLAGAVLSLQVSGDFFQESRYHHRAAKLLTRILTHQSPEGWFLEYEGADPGYQTLCLYYLAQVYRLRPDPDLRIALEKAITFLSWFVHPDGTFGGEYGSRRTAVFYPGGLALLSSEFPMAHTMTRFMLKAIISGRTVTLWDIDMGNLAPVLSNYVTVLEADLPDENQAMPPLPWEKIAKGAGRGSEAGSEISQDFSQAGLYVRGTPHYYAVVGASNGGVLKVFDRKKQTLIWNDGGYVGQMKGGTYITTQITDLNRLCQVTPAEITIETPFYIMLRAIPTPFQFILLRFLNLTVMRSVGLGNWIKSLLVRLLISGKRSLPLSLTRVVKFESERVIVTDVLRIKGQIAMRWLEFGRPFVAIHMASARYFENFPSAAIGMTSYKVDVEKLLVSGEIERQVII